ncbi:MAG: hypothetical protein GY946_05415, partial [bacterium]|nr:hypothetical protein [bacterium]
MRTRIPLASPGRIATVEDMMDSLVSTAWLSEHLYDPDLIVLDCSVRTVMDAQGGVTNHCGRSDYERAHVPTAGFADLLGGLCDRDNKIEFAIPTPPQFCKAMGALGVGNDSRVVLYDSFMSMWAARVWWMLRWVGFDNAAILDGGLQAWIAEGRPVATGTTVRPPHPLFPAPRPHLIADQEEVRAALDDDSVHL